MTKSVRKLETLLDVITFIGNKHKSIGLNNAGVYALKLLRQSDGTRIPFEEMQGIRIKDFIIQNDNSLVVEQEAHGTAFRGRKSITYDARIYLSNLAMINIYDYSAEFLTVNSVDFVYIENTKNASVVMMSEWINEQPGVLRGQWFMDRHAEKVFASIGVNSNTKNQEGFDRNIDLDMRL